MRPLLILSLALLGLTANAHAETKCDFLSRAFAQLRFTADYLEKTRFSDTEDIQASAILVDGMIEEVEKSLNDLQCGPPNVGPTHLLPRDGNCFVLSGIQSSLGGVARLFGFLAPSTPSIRHAAVINSATRSIISALNVQKQCVPSTF